MTTSKAAVLGAILAASCASRAATSHQNGTVTLHGNVVAAGGAPAGALIAAVPLAEGKQPVLASAEEDGAFRFVLEPGRYAFTVTHERLGAGYEKPIDVGPSTSALPTIKLEPGSITVSGTVKTATGAPAPNTIVTLMRWSAVEGDLFLVRADRHGKFTATLPQAPYTLFVRDEQWMSDSGIYVDGSSRDLHVAVFPAQDVYTAPDPASVLQIARAIRTDDPSLLVNALSDRLPRRGILGVGEANHGGQEFQDARHGLILELARRGLLRGVLLEAQIAGTQDLDAYLQGTSSNRLAAIEALKFSMWKTTAFAELADEIRRLNESRPPADRIHFFGIDPQFANAELLKTADALAGTGFAKTTLFRERFAPLLEADDVGNYQKLTNGARQEIRALLDEGIKHLRTNGSPALRNALAAKQALDLFSTQAAPYENVRDRYMTENALSVTQTERAGVFVMLAHNRHVSKSRVMGFVSVGDELERALGANYVAIGLAFRNGRVRAKVAADEPVREIDLPPPDESLLESMLPGGEYILNLTDVADRHLAKWLGTPHYMREFGLVYGAGPDRTRMRILREAFDYLVILDRITPTTPLKQ